VQAGIKMKVNDAGNEVRKDLLETESQQKLLRGMMKNEFEIAKRDIKREVKASIKEDQEKELDDNS